MRISPLCSFLGLVSLGIAVGVRADTLESGTFQVETWTPDIQVRERIVGAALSGPGSDVVASVSVSSSYDSQTGFWTYTYSVINDVTSPRGIWSFTLRPVPSVFNVTSPQGWEAQVGFQEPDQLNWFCMDPGPNPPDNDGNVAPSPYDTAPGQTGMFSFKTPVAPALGGMTFFLQGFSGIPIAQSDESDVDALLDSQPLFLDDSLMGQTDGPMSFVGIAPVEAPSGNYIVSVAPNPSISAQANMTFRLDHQALVKVDLFDVAGRKVRGLFDGQLPQGDHVVIWRGEADDGRPISAGLYYYRLMVDGVPIDSKAVVLVP